MSNFLITFGFLLWVTFSLTTFMLFSPRILKVTGRILYTVKFIGLGKTGAELGISALQLTGFMWLVVGIVIKTTNERVFNGTFGTILLILIFLAPVAIGAILVEIRSK